MEEFFKNIPKEVEKKLIEIQWFEFFEDFRINCLNRNYNFCHKAAMLLKDAKEDELSKQLLKMNCIDSENANPNTPKIIFASSCWTLGCILSQENRWPESLEYYKHACDVNRHPRACYNLGYAHRKGLTENAVKNAFLARKYFRISCLNYSHAKR